MSFRYLAKLRLYKYLGEYDALVQLEEVALRKFVMETAASPDPQAYVIAEAKKQGINVTVEASQALMLNAARTNVVVVYQSADQFFAEFREEHETLHGRTWVPKNDREPALEHTMRALGMPIPDVKRALGPLHIEVFDYYRLVRNLATHRHDPDDEGRWGEEADTGRQRQKLDAKLKRLHERFADELPDFRGRLSAPNAYDALTFDDFVMATRNLKQLATELSKIARPTDKRLLECLDEEADRFYRQAKNNHHRVRRRVASAARARFGLDWTEAERVGSLWQEPTAG